MKVCVNCGKKGTGSFCTSCGGKMVDEVTDKPSSTAEYAARQKAQQSSTAQYAANQKSQQSSTSPYPPQPNSQQSFKSTSNQNTSYQKPQNNFNQFNSEPSQLSQNQSFQTPFPAQTYPQPQPSQYGGMNPSSPSGNIPAEYQPISAFGYFGYTSLLLFLPPIGFILCCVFAFGGTQNINLKNYARGMLLIPLVVFVVVILFASMFMGCIGSSGYRY